MFDELNFDNGALPIGTISIDEIEVGMSRGISKTISVKDVEVFADLSVDHNPVHLDEDYAKDTHFGSCVVHGMLTASLFSAVIGEQLPGHGSIYLGQSLKFLGPVRPGDHVTARVSVREIDREKRRVTLDCIASVDDNPVLKGEALVLAPKSKTD